MTRTVGYYRRKADQQPVVTLLRVGDENIPGFGDVAFPIVAIVVLDAVVLITTTLV